MFHNLTCIYFSLFLSFPVREMFEIAPGYKFLIN